MEEARASTPLWATVVTLISGQKAVAGPSGCCAWFMSFIFPTLSTWRRAGCKAGPQINILHVRRRDDELAFSSLSLTKITNRGGEGGTWGSGVKMYCTLLILT